jgi:hypothetical protein
MPNDNSNAVKPIRRLRQLFPTTYAQLLPALMALTLVVACKITLIGDYDDVLDRGITDLQQTTETYFAKLLSTPATPYDQSFHDGTHARLVVLTSRATSLPKYTIITEQLHNLTTQFANFQQLDKITTRPVPAGVVNDTQSAIDTSIESLLKLEVSLKRTGIPSSGT